MSHPKLFKFDTNSFAPSKPVEEFLRSKGMISQETGEAAYINSQAMHSVLVDLIETSKANDKLRESLEKLQKSYQELRMQSADALTSLKILEDENDTLTRELERLSQSRNTLGPH